MEITSAALQLGFHLATLEAPDWKYWRTIVAEQGHGQRSICLDGREGMNALFPTVATSRHPLLRRISHLLHLSDSIRLLPRPTLSQSTACFDAPNGATHMKISKVGTQI